MSIIILIFFGLRLVSANAYNTVITHHMHEIELLQCYAFWIVLQCLTDRYLVCMDILLLESCLLRTHSVVGHRTFLVTEQSIRRAAKEDDALEAIDLQGTEVQSERFDFLCSCCGNNRGKKARAHWRKRLTWTKVIGNSLLF